MSASEVSYFSLTSNDIRQIKSQKTMLSNKILQLFKKPEYLLSTILIGNNFVNIAITVISTTVVALMFIGDENSFIYIVIQLFGIMLLILLFGDIIPKVFAIHKYLFFVKLMAYPLIVLKFIFYPLSWILISFTNIITKKIEKKTRDNISIKEISDAIAYASDLNEDKEMLEDIVNSNSIDVKDIMTSRVDMFAIEYESNFSKILGQVVESGFSRIPVYTENLDKIKGILYIKDLIPYINTEDKENFNWQKLIRQHFVVPENKKINELLTDFQKKKLHIAIIVDEYGGVSGLVTLEDVLEEFIGEIHDETDIDEDEGKLYTKISNNIYEFDAKTSIIDFCKIIDADFHIFENLKGEAESLAGLILEINNTIPKKDVIITIKNYEFKVISSDERKIKKIQIKIN